MGGLLWEASCWKPPTRGILLEASYWRPPIKFLSTSYQNSYEIPIKTFLTITSDWIWITSLSLTRMVKTRSCCPTPLLQHAHPMPQP